MALHFRGIAVSRQQLHVHCLLGLARRGYLSADLKHMSECFVELDALSMPTCATGGQGVAHLEACAPQGL